MTMTSDMMISSSRPSGLCNLQQPLVQHILLFAFERSSAWCAAPACRALSAGSDAFKYLWLRDRGAVLCYDRNRAGLSSLRTSFLDDASVMLRLHRRQRLSGIHFGPTLLDVLLASAAKGGAAGCLSMQWVHMQPFQPVKTAVVKHPSPRHIDPSHIEHPVLANDFDMCEDVRCEHRPYRITPAHSPVEKIDSDDLRKAEHIILDAARANFGKPSRLNNQGKCRPLEPGNIPAMLRTCVYRNCFAERSDQDRLVGSWRSTCKTYSIMMMADGSLALDDGRGQGALNQNGDWWEAALPTGRLRLAYQYTPWEYRTGDPCRIIINFMPYHKSRWGRNIVCMRVGLPQPLSNYENVLDAILAHAENGLPLTEESLLSWHGMCFHGLLPRAGHFRSVGVRCGPHKGVAPRLVKGAMLEYVQEATQIVARSDLSGCAKAAWCAYHLVDVHPFEDGNGRLSRLVAIWALARHGFKELSCLPHFSGSFNWLICSRREYIRALRQSPDNGSAPHLPLAKHLCGMLFGTLWHLKVLPHNFDLPWHFYSMWPAYSAGDDAADDDNDVESVAKDTLIFESASDWSLPYGSTIFDEDETWTSIAVTGGFSEVLPGESLETPEPGGQEEHEGRWCARKLVSWEKKEPKRTAKSLRSRRSRDGSD